MANDTPRLREWIRGYAGNEAEGYWQEWYCDVPADRVPFYVKRDEWDDDYTVRRIFEIAPAGRRAPH